MYIIHLHKTDASSGELFCAYVPTVITFLGIPKQLNVDELPDYDEGCMDIANFLGFGNQSIPEINSEAEVVQKMQSEKVLAVFPFNETVSLQKMLEMEQCLYVEKQDYNFAYEAYKTISILLPRHEIEIPSERDIRLKLNRPSEYAYYNHLLSLSSECSDLHKIHSDYFPTSVYSVNTGPVALSRIR
jgi:hypothetical protein